MKIKNDLKECSIVDGKNGFGEIQMLLEYKGRMFPVTLTSIMGVDMFLTASAMYNGEERENIPEKVIEFLDDVRNNSVFNDSFNMIDCDLLPTTMEIASDLHFVLADEQEEEEFQLEFKNATVRVSDTMQFGKIEIIKKESES